MIIISAMVALKMMCFVTYTCHLCHLFNIT